MASTFDKIVQLWIEPRQQEWQGSQASDSVTFKLSTTANPLNDFRLTFVPFK